jgi:hypothetical protein
VAGDWIKWSKGLTKKSEVVGIAARLKLSRRETAALLMEVWEWAEDQTENGHVPSVTNGTLDDLFSVAGLGFAMLSEGWLKEVDGGIKFPNFDRHNGKPAKTRALASERKRKFRTKESRDQRDDFVTPLLFSISRSISINDALKPHLIDWLEYRHSIKKPVSDVAAIRIVRKYNDNPSEFGSLIDRAINNGWQGFDFPEKNGARSSAAAHGSATEANLALIKQLELEAAK